MARKVTLTYTFTDESEATVVTSMYPVPVREAAPAALQSSRTMTSRSA